MSITDELRAWAKALSLWWYDPEKNEYTYTTGCSVPSLDAVRLDEHILAIADRIDAEHEAALLDAHVDLMDASGWMKLPKDADGVPIRVGDVMEPIGSGLLFGEASFEVRSMRCDECGWEVYDRLGDRYAPSLLRHHHATTVEDVLREFFSRYVTTKPKEEDDAIIAEFAAKLRLAGDAE